MTSRRILMLVLMVAVCMMSAGIGAAATTFTYELNEIWESIPGPSVEWLEYSPDASMVAIGYGDYKVRIWNTSSGLEIITLDKHKSIISSVDWSPDGTTLLTCPRYGNLTLWDTSNWTEKLEINADLRAFFSPDGNKIIAGSYNLKVFNSTTGVLINNFILPDEAGASNNPATQMDWSADNHHVAIGSTDGKVRIINTTTGITEQEWSPGAPDKWVSNVRYSPDGTKLLTSVLDRMTRIWDISSMALIHSIDGGNSAEWAPNSTTIAVLNDGIVLWDINTKTSIYYPDNSLDHNARIDWSPITEKNMIVTGSSDSIAKIWDTSGAVINILNVSNPIGHMASPITVKFSPDGTRVSSGDRNGLIYIWNATTGGFVRGINGHNGNSIQSVDWSHDGTRLASGARDGFIRIWDWRNGSSLLSVDLTSTDHRMVHSVAFSHDDSKIAVGITEWGGANDSKLLVLDARNGNILIDINVKIWPRYDGTQDTVSWSPDDTQIASIDGKRVVIWNALTGVEIKAKTLSEDVIRTAWSPDGTKIAALSNTVFANRTIPKTKGTLGIWNLTTDSYAELVPNGTDEYANYLVWSPDSNMVLFKPDIIDMNGNKLVRVGSVSAVDWSPDSTKIIGTHQHSVVLWNLSEYTNDLLPAISITSPTNGTEFTTSTITISGIASADTAVASVTVNGILATGTTSWSADVTLAEGANTITVIATDTSGNTATDTITITYTPAAGTLTGDVNGDGILSSVDALMALQMSAGNIAEDLVADVNGDGSVTSLDALMILQASVGAIVLEAIS